MGAGQSSAARRKKAQSMATSPSVAGDLVRSADIVINSSRKSTHTLDAAKTSKAQRLATSAGALDEVVAWLDWEFAKHDNNKDGFLDYHEFVNFIRSLNLKMTTKEIFQFFLLADRDNDYRIVWCEIEQDVPRILSKIYEGIPEGPQDWCLMVRRTEGGKKGGKEEEEVWYFNKRTSEVSKERPMEMGDGSGEDGEGGREDGEEGGRREAVLENTKTLDVALTWLDWEFKKEDFDKNGVLSHHECMAFIRGLRLGLNEKEVEQFTRLADSNGDGVVEWTEVLELTPLILRKLYTALPPGPHDWCAIIDAEGKEYYLNKRTGVTVSTRPPDYVPAATTTEGAEAEAEGGEVVGEGKKEEA